MLYDDTIINPRQGGKPPPNQSYDKFIDLLPDPTATEYTPKQQQCLETLREGLKRMKYANLYSGAGGQLKNLIKQQFPNFPSEATNAKIAEFMCNPPGTTPDSDFRKLACCEWGSEVPPNGPGLGDGPKCYLCGLPVNRLDNEQRMVNRIAELFTYWPDTGLAPKDKTNLTTRLKNKVTSQYGSACQIEHLQSIAHSAYTGLLPKDEGDSAHQAVFALAHRCCNILKTNDEFIRQFKSEDEANDIWGIDYPTIYTFYNDLFGKTTNGDIKNSAKNWYASCYNVYWRPPLNLDHYKTYFITKVFPKFIGKLQTVCDILNDSNWNRSIYNRRNQFKHILFHLINKCVISKTNDSSATRLDQVVARANRLLRGGGITRWLASARKKIEDVQEGLEALLNNLSEAEQRKDKLVLVERSQEFSETIYVVPEIDIFEVPVSAGNLIISYIKKHGLSKFLEQTKIAKQVFQQPEKVKEIALENQNLTLEWDYVVKAKQQAQNEHDQYQEPPSKQEEISNNQEQIVEQASILASKIQEFEEIVDTGVSTSSFFPNAQQEQEMNEEIAENCSETDPYNWGITQLNTNLINTLDSIGSLYNDDNIYMLLNELKNFVRQFEQAIRDYGIAHTDEGNKCFYISHI